MLKKLVLTSLLVAQTIFAAEVKLREAIELLTSESPSTGNSGNSGEFVACYEFAYQKYYINLNSSNAADKATAACKAGLDLEVAKFLYEKYYINLNAVNSMDKAVEGAAKLNRDSLVCVQKLYATYYVSHNATNSVNSAVAGCSK